MFKILLSSDRVCVKVVRIARIVWIKTTCIVLRLANIDVQIAKTIDVRSVSIEKKCLHAIIACGLFKALI